MYFNFGWQKIESFSIHGSEVEEEEGEMEDEEVDENDDMDEVEKEVHGNDGIAEVEEEDEELSKWNAEDDRKHLEMQLEEKLEEEKDLEKSDSSADLLSAPLLEKTQRTMNEVNLPEESTQWSDSSSLIAPGQGNCICATATGDVKSTPFTKLLKSGLLDSASKSSVGKGNSVEEVSPFLFGGTMFMQRRPCRFRGCCEKLYLLEISEAKSFFTWCFLRRCFFLKCYVLR